MYIYEKQLEEADLIVLNKADLVSRDELAEVEATLAREFSQAPVLAISARDGDGVDSWLDRVLALDDGGRTVAEIDYDRYAEGEAALGWLNAGIRLHGRSDVDWSAFCLGILKAMHRDLEDLSAAIAHLKLYLAAGRGVLLANLTANDREPSLRARGADSPPDAFLLINCAGGDRSGATAGDCPKVCCRGCRHEDSRGNGRPAELRPLAADADASIPVHRMTASAASIAPCGCGGALARPGKWRCGGLRFPR